MGFTDAIKYGFKNYANFKGVVDRATFWWWYLFAAIVSIAIQTIGGAISGASSFSALSGGDSSSVGSSAAVNFLLSLLPLAIYLPTLALVVRRMRDAGTNPLLLLLGLIPGAALFIGAAVGAVAGASMSSGYGSLGNGFLGLFLGMIPGILLGLGYGIWMIVTLAKPTKTAAQGNKYAVA
ncbi:MAG: DUF805 domain-containing protein [Rhodoluna sp.]|nr:DUF805 domain-containing protein [Rhodoluna sp.]